MAGMIFGEPGLLYWRYSRDRPCRLPVGLVSCLPGWPSLLASVFRAVRCPANFPVLPLVPASPGRHGGTKILRVQKLQQALKIHRKPPFELPFTDSMKVTVLVIPLVNSVAILIAGLNHFPDLSVFPFRSSEFSRQSHFRKIQQTHPVSIIPGDTGLLVTGQGQATRENGFL